MSNFHQQEGTNRVLRSSQRQVEQSNGSNDGSSGPDSSHNVYQDDDAMSTGQNGSLSPQYRRSNAPTRTREVWTPEEHERFLEVCYFIFFFL